jgi:hypothetical protein
MTYAMLTSSDRQLSGIVCQSDVKIFLPLRKQLCISVTPEIIASAPFGAASERPRERLLGKLNSGRAPHSMAIDKGSACDAWTPWTPFCKRQGPCHRDMQHTDWPGAARTVGQSFATTFPEFWRALKRLR